MFILHGDSEDWTQWPEGEIEPILAAHAAFESDLRSVGAFVASEALQPPSAVTTVRLKDGKPLLTDGPYIETKEYIGGFYVIEVQDLDQALIWAKRLADIEQHPIEVWPVLI